MSSKHNTNPDTNGATAPEKLVSTDRFHFAGGTLVSQVPFRVHGKAGSLIDRFAEKHGLGKTEYVRRVVYQKLAEELEEEAMELRAAVSS